MIIKEFPLPITNNFKNKKNDKKKGGIPPFFLKYFMPLLGTKTNKTIHCITSNQICPVA